MNIRNWTAIILIISLAVCIGCQSKIPTSDTGVKRATATVQTNNRGLTTEQENIITRLKKDNQPGAIKHLYVLSAYSGEVLLYSTIKGKVTSSGKRLTPYLLDTDNWATMRVDIGGETFYTSEVIQDDGTYGHSIPYLFWTDQAGIFHKHYVSGGQIVHISDQPTTFGRVTMTVVGE